MCVCVWWVNRTQMTTKGERKMDAVVIVWVPQNLTRNQSDVFKETFANVLYEWIYQIRFENSLWQEINRGNSSERCSSLHRKRDSLKNVKFVKEMIQMLTVFQPLGQFVIVSMSDSATAGPPEWLPSESKGESRQSEKGRRFYIYALRCGSWLRSVSPVQPVGETTVMALVSGSWILWFWGIQYSKGDQLSNRLIGLLNDQSKSYLNYLK